MADNGVSPSVGSGLPWSRDLGESRRFAGIVLAMLVLFLPPALLIPMLEVPEVERSEAEKVPPRLARLVEKPKPVVPPEPAQPEPEPEPETEPEVKKEKPKQPEPKVARVEPDPAPAPKPESEPQAESEPKPKQTTEQAREKASRSGLLAMRDKLASLRSPEPTPAREFVVNTQPSTEATKSPEDSQQVLSGSGGVEEAPAPETAVAVAEHEVKTVDAPVEESREVAAKPAKAERSVGERAMSNIRQVFDAQKTALYSMYRRELRQDPTLEGKVLLELVIEPDGSVSACEVVSSELEHPTLEQRIAMRVRLFNFGADNVEARKVRFPIDFLPG